MASATTTSCPPGCSPSFSSPSPYPCPCSVAFPSGSRDPRRRPSDASPSGSILRVLRRRRANRLVLNATGSRVLHNAPPSPAHPQPNATATAPAIEIPVSCFQLLGASDQAEKDVIVKLVMELKRLEADEGYTLEATMARQNLLMDIRDKLLFEPEYAGNVKEKVPPKSSLRIPWTWLPGALCLLQEVGEENLVLQIGRAALQHPDAKPYTHDLLLSMALAECAIAKSGFEKNKVSLGFEALARAQSLLRSRSSLAKLSLLCEIEESLEELAPACTLDLLGMPHTPENAERRQGAIAALRELLRQGLDVETTCRVQDWSSFLVQACSKLLAVEIVELLPWNDLAVVRKNKKSLESQNQRVVIDFSCFYLVLVAHIALGFSSKQTEMIHKARILCECLMASEGVDLKYEEAFCLFLLGQGSESEAVEKLQQLESSSNPAARSLLHGKEIKDGTGGKPSLKPRACLDEHLWSLRMSYWNKNTVDLYEKIRLYLEIDGEKWLKDAVLALFPDTRDSSASLVNFLHGEKRALGNKKTKLPLQTNHANRPLSDVASRRMDGGESLASINSSQHLRSAVKQLAPSDLQSSLTLGKNVMESNVNESSTQLKRSLGSSHDETWERWFSKWLVGKIAVVSMIGCFGFITFRLSGIGMKATVAELASTSTSNGTCSLVMERSSPGARHPGPTNFGGNGIAVRMRKILEKVNLDATNQLEAEKLDIPGFGTSKSASVAWKQMAIEEAEALVKQWQAIKSEALGPSHQLDSLNEVLDESMLDQWLALADAAKAKSCYWRFVLLQLSVLHADIFTDKFGMEVAVIEALLKEAAELVDESQEKNPNYYSSYTVRYVLKKQDDGSWRFCEGNIQTPS